MNQLRKRDPLHRLKGQARENTKDALAFWKTQLEENVVSRFDIYEEDPYQARARLKREIADQKQILEELIDHFKKVRESEKMMKMKDQEAGASNNDKSHMRIYLGSDPVAYVFYPWTKVIEMLEKYQTRSDIYRGMDEPETILCYKGIELPENKTIEILGIPNWSSILVKLNGTRRTKMGAEPYRLFDAAPKFRTVAQATRAGDIPFIKDLLERHPLMNCHDHDETLCEHLRLYEWGVTPLYVAVDQKHMDVTKWLLDEKKVDINVGCSGEESTIIHEVEATGLEAALGRATRVEKEYVLWPPLWIAIKNGHQEMVEYLIEKKAQVELTLAIVHEHCPLGPVGIVKKKMINFFHKLAYNRRQSGLKTWQHITMAQAAYSGDVVLMRRLKIGGCTVGAICTSMTIKWTEIRELGIEGVTPLVASVFRYQKASFYWLLENVAPLDSNTTGEKRWSALKVAVYKNHMYLAMELLSRGAKWDTEDMEEFVLQNCEGQARENGKQLVLEMKSYLGDEDEIPDVEEFAKFRINTMREAAARKLQDLYHIRQSIKKRQKLLADAMAKKRKEDEERRVMEEKKAEDERIWLEQKRQAEIKRMLEISSGEEDGSEEDSDDEEKAEEVDDDEDSW